VLVFRFIEKEKATYPIRALCRLLCASVSGLTRLAESAGIRAAHGRRVRSSGQDEFHDGYHYHDPAGVRRYHGEQHVYLVKRLNGADS
jgi:hypothetical protein